MVDGLVEVISKPEVLEISHTDFYSHISLINIVSEDKLELFAEFDNSSRETSARFIDGKFGEIITAKPEKKNHVLIEKYDKACQVNFVETNIKTCY